MTEYGMAIEHAWILKDGYVIDPTLPCSVIAYFAGLEFLGRSEVKDFLATKEGGKCRKSPFFYAFGFGGGMSPSFAAAARACRAFHVS